MMSLVKRLVQKVLSPSTRGSQTAPTISQTKIMPLTEDDLTAAWSVVRADSTRLLQVAAVREAITLRRLAALDAKSFRMMADPVGAISNTVEHNYRNIQDCLDRPDRLIGILPSLQTVRTDMSTKKVLVIGPRSECELFTLVAVGFSPENIRGLDLIAYNESVDLGDMHEAPYQDASFDIIILSAVWGYSSEPKKLADEVCRLARPGAVVAISQEYNPMTSEELIRVTGTPLTVDRPRYDSIDQVISPFGERIQSVVFRQDLANVPASWAQDRVVEMLVVFIMK